MIKVESIASEIPIENDSHIGPIKSVELALPKETQNPNTPSARPFSEFKLNLDAAPLTAV